MASSFGPSWVVQADFLGAATGSFSPSWTALVDVVGGASQGPSWVVTVTAPSQVSEIRTRQVRSLVGLGDWPQRIASTNNISFTSVAGTSMFTVPTDPTIDGYYVTDVIIRADGAGGVTGVPTIAIGTTNGGSDILAPTVLTSFNTQGQMWLARNMGLMPYLKAGKSIFFNVTVAATISNANNSFFFGQVEILGFPVVS